MQKYATWRRRSEDPRTALGWFLPMAFRGRTEFNRRGRIFVAIAIPLVFLMAWVAKNPILIFSSIASFVYPLLIDSPEARLHAAIPTLDEETEAVPIALSIFDANGRRTGKEMGWVAFSDGWLVYEGLRTSFALNRESVQGLSYDPDGLILTLHDGRRVEFRKLADPQQTYLPSGIGRVGHLANAARAWWKIPSAPGAALLPPRFLHPEVATNKLALPLVGALFALSIGALALWGEFFKLGGGCLLVALGCFAWLVVDVHRFREALPSMIESNAPIE